MPAVSPIHEFGPFRLDSTERLLTRAGHPVPVAPKAFDLLVYLVERRGRLVTKRELMTALWPDTFVEETNLTSTVSALRKALGDGHDGEQFIQTVPTPGYRSVAPVTHEVDAPVASMLDKTASSRRDVLRRVANIALVIALIAMLPVVLRHLYETADAPVSVRFTIPVPDSAVGTASVAAAQISPDGRRVAFVAGSDARRIWIRGMDALRAGPVPGTEDAFSLFWAPDGQQLAFTTSSALKKLTVSDGTVETLCAPCRPGRGRTWSRNGFILFPSRDGGLIGLPVARGEPEAITSLNRSDGEVAHISPHFLPDGRQFLYLIRNADPSRSGLHVGQVGSARSRLLLQGEHRAIYAAPGYLLFTRAGNIVAQAFDVERLELSGNMIPIVAPSEYSPTPVQGGDVSVLNWFATWPGFSASDTDVLTYDIAEHPATQFQWRSRSGELLRLVGEPGSFMTFDLSTDDAHLVFSRRAEHASLWILDLARGISSRLTFGPSSSYSSPRWGPENEWVAAHRPAPPPLAIVKVLRDGRESIVSAPGGQGCILDDVSNDGHFLLCRPQGTDLLAMPLDGGEPILVRSPPAGSIDQAQFSPDSRWIAYNADESGQYEVYLTPFPPTGERWPVSHGGGVQPVWRQDGRELYYLGLDGVLKAVELRVADRPQFSAPNLCSIPDLWPPRPG